MTNFMDIPGKIADLEAIIQEMEIALEVALEKGDKSEVQSIRNTLARLRNELHGLKLRISKQVN